MSIAGLSSNSITDWSQQTQQNPFKQIKQDFKQLASALQSGNLSEAQSAYSNIQKVLQANGGSSSSNDPTTLQTDFSTLGQALQSGNLSQAQSAFSQLQSDFQANNQSTAGAVTQPQDLYVPSQSQEQTPAQQARQDYTQLANALQSGNLTNAQSAYAALQQLVQAQTGANGASNTNSSTNSTNGNDAITNDFSALGQALAAGDLTQAQSVFSQLQSAVQAAQQLGTSQTQNGTQVAAPHGHHHHHHHGGGSSSQSASSTSTTGTSSTSTTSSNISLYA